MYNYNYSRWRRPKPVPKILLPGMSGYSQWQTLLRIVLYPKRLLSGVTRLLVAPIRQPRPISDFRAWQYKRGHYDRP